jgi:diacylglycerol kinase (ATP)
VGEIALLANPQSGSGEADRVEALLRDHGAEVRRFGLDEADRVIGANPRRVVVAGGDGSIGCAAEVAARVQAPLAVVPVGTANDFARAVEIPLDPAAAAELAALGSRTRALDLGEVGERPFVNAASAGLSPVAARKAHGLKRALGPLAYAVGALRAGLTAQPLRCEVSCDGEELFAGSAWQVTVACTGAFGGGAAVEADPEDGVLDVVVIEATSRQRLAIHAYGMRAGRVERHAGVITGSGREVGVDTERGTDFNIDGELVEADRLRFTVRQRAFEVVVG